MKEDVQQSLSPTSSPARIAVLDTSVSAGIAAGEVLEQPASAVRELLDNALDAGATRIRVEIRDGGKRLIRVEDNGCGMAEADLAVCTAKHATSKIHSLDDLGRITSLGFRGEALFALAAVSRLRIISDVGQGARELLVEEGHTHYLREAAGAPGTVVEVSELFRNLPARLAFLKSDLAETRAVKREVVNRMLAFPRVAFDFLVNGETRLHSNGGSLRSRIGDVLGRSLAEALIEVSCSEGGVSISGFVTPVHRNTATRRDQYFVVNQRPVFVPALSHALSAAYGNMLGAGRYAAAVLRIDMDPARLNVNVHPAKREVRLGNEREVHQLLLHGVQTALQSGTDFARPRATPVQPTDPRAPDQELQPPPSFLFPVRETRPPQQESGLAALQAAQTAGERPGLFTGYRLQGCLYDNYWILEGRDGFLLADQHAVHERVLYEKYRAQYAAGGVQRQALLIPARVRLGEGEVERLAAMGEAVEQAGFVVEPFGPDSHVIREVPHALQGDPEQALRELLAAWDGPRGSRRKDNQERMLATLACRSAVMRGDRLQPQAMWEILDGLNHLERPFSCPHGRPSIVEFSLDQLEKWFLRR